MSVDLQNTILNVAAWQEQSLVSGPGARFLLWLQGCPFRCAGCINENFLKFAPKRLIPVAELADRISAVSGIEGVTFSGGEPMAQAAALTPLSLRLRERGLSIVCYSGYTLAELRSHQDPSPSALLDCLDILIDGRFDQSQRANLPWRGSRNQQIHFLSPRYKHWQSQMNESASELELLVGGSGVTATGILSRRLLRQLNVVMKEDSR